MFSSYKSLAFLHCFTTGKAEMMAAQLASVDFDCSRSLPRLGKQYRRRCGLDDSAGAFWGDFLDFMVYTDWNSCSFLQ